jgi:signal transduction histidine kinase
MDGSRRLADGTGDGRLRTIIDHLADGVLIVSPAGTVRFANPAAGAMFGRAAEELRGADLGLPLDGGGAAEIDVVPRGGAPAVAELRVAEIEWEGEPAMLVSLRDTTERREAEEQRLRAEREEAARGEAESAARRAELLAEAGAAVAGSLDARPTLRRLAALAVPELADWVAFDLRDASGAASRVASSPEGADGPPAGAALLEVPLEAGGERLGTALFAADRGRRTGTDAILARDFAFRAAMAVSSARLYEASQAASEAKGEFLAVMSHELRTPLNAILGYADLLEAGVFGEVPEGQQAQLERIQANARHLLDIVDEILTFTRVEQGIERVRRRDVDLNRLVREVAEALEPLARRKELALEVSVPDEPAVVDTDPGKVRQILANLLSNAVKFTEEGTVSMWAVRDGTHHLVSVRDTGIGIAAEDVERIFEPFWQVEQSARREVGGTGLGLAVARDLAELLGGWLKVESAPGEGATFTLGIPAAD